MGEDLVESGSVPILCQVSADVLETQRYLSDDEEERQNHRRMIHAALLALCNYTDISRAVTKAVKEHGVLVPVLLDKLSEWRAQYLDGTLNTSEVLWDYLLATDDDIRVMSLATLADISTDAESGRLTTSSDLVKFVLNLLRETLGSADHTYNGWRGAEILSDSWPEMTSTKKLLVDDGVLPLLVQGVDSVLEDEKVESMEALWRLSFSKDNKARFVENEELMDLVRKVFYDRKEKDFCRVAAQGILEQVGCQLSKTLDSVPNV
ncbi:hypothetical protein BaRGS_00005835 [Batillaria attramentaria]|uniref:Uncharacterized protein n=1 Tax=Batillaria attramentaria TaxID=370345 RepID=A0ABD0LTR5_9CAEN